MVYFSILIGPPLGSAYCCSEPRDVSSGDHSIGTAAAEAKGAAFAETVHKYVTPILSLACALPCLMCLMCLSSLSILST
jgi:hypothetical protein